MKNRLSKDYIAIMITSIIIFFLVIFMTWNNVEAVFIAAAAIIFLTLVANLINIFHVNQYHRENAILRSYLIKNKENPDKIIGEELGKKDIKWITRFTLRLMIFVTLAYILFAALTGEFSSLDGIFQYLVNIATFAGILVVLEDRSK